MVIVISNDVAYVQSQNSKLRDRVRKALPAYVSKRHGDWDKHFKVAREDKDGDRQEELFEGQGNRNEIKQNFYRELQAAIPEVISGRVGRGSGGVSKSSGPEVVKPAETTEVVDDEQQPSVPGKPAPVKPTMEVFAEKTPEERRALVALAKSFVPGDNVTKEIVR